jgi:hypothetical protein
MGTQVCSDDGTKYEACSCNSTGSSGTGGGSSTAPLPGTGGSGGTSTAGAAGSSSANTPLFPGGVGVPCTSDAGCGGAPLVCVLASSDSFHATDAQTGADIGGGPQGGYCTLPCQASADCQAVDNISLCNTAVGYCFGLCTPSTGPTKCVDSQGAASAQSCLQLSDTDTSLGVCIPTCTNDAGCGTGRYCDLNTGLCVGTKPTGKAIGEACDGTQNGADCASGTCVQFTAGSADVSFCSGNCTLGILDNCGYDPASGQPRNVACLEPQFAQAAAGDIGFCVSLCDVAADCAQAGWICEPLSAAGAQALGRTGECLPPGLVADAGAGG